MRLWTIQKEDVYTKLLNDKTHTCDIYESELAKRESFKIAYDWIKREMSKMLNDETDLYPIWAWYKYNNKNKQPDLRMSGYAAKGTKCVCLEIEIPDNKVLLSDFELWHYVLNNWYINNDEEDDKWFDNLPKELELNEKEKSWMRIFNTTNSDFIQATFFELKIDNVKKVKHFVSR